MMFGLGVSGMGRTATEYALSRLNRFTRRQYYKTLVLGSIHNIDIQYDTQLDWKNRTGDNVNFLFDRINSGSWNLIINCCCEHMYPMSEITLRGMYLLQSNNYNTIGHIHINRCKDLETHISQTGLDVVHYSDTSIFHGIEYYTVIGEKL